MLRNASRLLHWNSSLSWGLNNQIPKIQNLVCHEKTVSRNYNAAPLSQSHLPVSTQPKPDIISVINQQIELESHGRLFAVIHLGGKQFKITTDDVIGIKGYWAPDIGDRLRLEKILLVGGSDFTLIGKPLLPRDLVRIEGTVIEKTLTETKMHFRMIPRACYKRLWFYRTPYTMIRINFIKFDGRVDELKDVEGLRQSPLW